MALNLDSDQIEVIREICDLGTDQLDDLTAKLTALGDAQQSACEKDIAQWTAIKYGMVRVQGGTQGTQYDIQLDRDLITDRMRKRLGYPRLSSTQYIPSNDIGSFTLRTPSWNQPRVFGAGEEDCDPWQI
jgi:hypothetical protein